jgi:5-methyltetrahydropteroyltriglutamate--homocysteine methyltransferase
MPSTNPYRADHVGSLLRPPELLAAREDAAQGRISAEQLREVEDQAILKALDLQRAVGIDIYTDGEYRRSWWAGALAESVEGLIPDPTPTGTPGAGAGRGWQGFTRELATATLAQVAGGPMVVGAKLRQVRRLAGHESAFLHQHAPGPWKITMPGVMQRAAGWYRQGLTDQFYPTPADLIAEFLGMMQREIAMLIDEGCSYIQLDSLRYIGLTDPVRRQQLLDSGTDPDQYLEETITSDNAALEGARRSGVTVGLHMCRGNNRSAWSSTGGYEPFAEQAFSRLNVDRFLLEYDTDRAGGFEPLRFVPRDKMVVLGLISSKDPVLESQDNLRRRIDEAAKYVPIENLAISPQCGFASTAPGNMLTWDEQRRKLELVVETARKVWG